MSILTNNLLSNTYRKIRNNLPDFVFASVKRLLPLYLITSLFEIFSLVIIFPVINILIEPGSIARNPYLLFLYEYFRFDNAVSFVLFLLCVIALFFILKNMIIYLTSRVQTRIAFEIASKLAFRKYSAYLSRPYDFFTDNNTAVLLRNFAQIPFELVTYVILPFAIILNEVLILSLIVIIMCSFDPLLFLAIIVFALPFALIYNSLYRKKLKDISDKRNRESATIYKMGMQSMDGFREMTVFNKLDYFKPFFQKSLNDYTRTYSDIYFLNQFSPKIVETVAVICIAGIFTAGYLFGKDLQSLGQFLIIFSLAAFRMIPSMNKIILSGNYIKSTAFALDYFDKHEGEEPRPQNTVSGPAISFKRALEIKDLHFSYKGSAKSVLGGINLEIRKGETVGIIGPSGSGKTTLLNILLRLYTESEGGIYVDGIKIAQSNIKEWYDLVSYVPQNITLLDGTIKENIAFGIDPLSIDPGLLRSVIERAQLKDFVGSLPMKEDSQIGENGIRISGGQRQRIGIARALYHGGQILIFDEATSSLDAETERTLTEAINNISHQELTIIIVAHRIQTLKYCDRIYRIANGKLDPSPLTYSELSKA
ncbi:MAG: ABC transporter ATP-binding protein [Bacteroidota bacterium]